MKFLNQFIICFCLFISSLGFSQTSVNDFKYISVADNYSFLKLKDQYQLNSLTVFLFEKNNFTVLNSLQNYPSDLAQNSCLLLKSDVIRIKVLFKTKLQLVLTDCHDNIVFSSEIGQSKLKDFKKAYQEALRNTFVSVSDLNYSYSGETPYDKPAIPFIVKSPPEPIIVSSTPSVVAPKLNVKTVEVPSILIVKATNSGYDFIDNITKKVSYSAQLTMFENVYIIEGKSGIIYKRGNSWVREYYEENKTIIEALNIRH